MLVGREDFEDMAYSKLQLKTHNCGEPNNVIYLFCKICTFHVNISPCIMICFYDNLYHRKNAHNERIAILLGRYR